jgi:hypothetical protein
MHWVLLVPYCLFSSMKFDKVCDNLLSPLHFTMKKHSRNRTTPQTRTTLQDRSNRNEKMGNGAGSGDVSHCTYRHPLAQTVLSL